MKTHASFVSSVSKERGDGDSPPGNELSALLSEALPRHGVEVVDSGRTDYSHTFHLRSGRRSFYAMVGLVDDEHPREWLFFADSSLGRVRRLLGASDEDEHRAVLEAAHRVLSADPRISEVRWYTADDWNKRPETHWFAEPAAR